MIFKYFNLGYDLIMKIITKVLLLISTFIVLNGCTEADIRALNNALYGYSGQSSYSSGSSGAVGFKTGETISGFNKICFYNKLGSTYTLNIPSTSLCPLTIR
tara:strand:+ start:352 stop:657 length:306 start_codon:yes stop_codon:yes gene_type:complete